MSVCLCVCVWDKVFEFVSSSGCVFQSGLGLDHDGFKRLIIIIIIFLRLIASTNGF